MSAIRVPDWWRRRPRLFSRDDYLWPLLDDTLAREMSRLAAAAAAEDDRLDYSVASIGAVEEALSAGGRSDAELHRLGAYVGEVLRRNVEGFAWAVAPLPPHTPGLALAHQLEDPFELVERYSQPRPHAEDTLANAIDELLTYAQSPTEETARRLGWSAESLEE